VANETPADKMRALCEALLLGDFMTAMAELSPQAMAEAMTMAGSFTGAPMPTSYGIDSEEVVGGEHAFKLHFSSGEREMRANCTWGQVEGEWKIVKIGVDSVT
jgi:hypothetical protein